MWKEKYIKLLTVLPWWLYQGILSIGTMHPSFNSFQADWVTYLWICISALTYYYRWLVRLKSLTKLLRLVSTVCFCSVLTGLCVTMSHIQWCHKSLSMEDLIVACIVLWWLLSLAQVQYDSMGDLVIVFGISKVLCIVSRVSSVLT